MKILPKSVNRQLSSAALYKPTQCLRRSAPSRSFSANYPLRTKFFCERLQVGENVGMQFVRIYHLFFYCLSIVSGLL